MSLGNEIDKIVKKSIDDFGVYLKKSNIYNDLITSKLDILKEQKNINDLFKTFSNQLNKNEIQKLVYDVGNIIVVINKCSYYCFFLFYFFYVKVKTIEELTSSLIKFNNNQINYGFQINVGNLSNINIDLIKYYKYIKYSEEFLSSKDHSIKSNSDESLIKEVIDLLNNQKILKYLKPEKVIDVQRLVGYIILSKIYQNDHKIITKQMLEKEFNSYETKIIKVIIDTKTTINLKAIENVVGYKNKQIAHGLYDLIDDSCEKLKPSDSYTINNLFGDNINPINNDFLHYYNSNESITSTLNKKRLAQMYGDVEEKINQDPKEKKKESVTILQSIVQKYETVIDYYENKFKEFFYEPLKYRKAILYNELEELKAINKIKNAGKEVENQQHFLKILLNIRSYAYTNFKEFSNVGFRYYPNKVINALRYSNIEYNNINPKLQLDYRVCSPNLEGNIVGMCINTNPTKNIKCYSKNKLINISSIYEKTKDINLDDLIVLIIKKYMIETLDIMIIDDKIYTKYKKPKDDDLNIYDSIIYWIFDPENDKNKMSTSIYSNDYIYICTQIYNKIKKIYLEHFINKKKKKKINYEQIKYLNYFIDRTFIKLNDNEMTHLTLNISEHIKYPLDTYISDYKYKFNGMITYHPKKIIN